MDELRRTELPAAPETSQPPPGKVHWRKTMDGLWTKALCPNMRTAPSALRYNCIAWAPCLTGEMICCVSPEQQSQQYGRKFLMVFVPVTNGMLCPLLSNRQRIPCFPHKILLTFQVIWRTIIGMAKVDGGFVMPLGKRDAWSQGVSAAYTLERNNKGKGRRMQPSGTTSPKDTCPA